MKKTQKFPSEKELKRVRKLLNKGRASRPLPPDASPVEKLKYLLCAEFVKYINQKKISQKEFAMQLGIDEALMSKLLNYVYDEFTIDRLFKYLSIIYPSFDVQLLVA
jgi:predicted XRE-type DNA-binding protein